MRIKKVSETTPITGNVINGYSESTEDGYSADYINGLLNKKVEILYSALISSTQTASYTFDEKGLYLLVASTNGNDCCTIDVIYDKAEYKSRIISDSRNYTNVSYSNKTVTITSAYFARISILKLM